MTTLPSPSPIRPHLHQSYHKQTSQDLTQTTEEYLNSRVWNEIFPQYNFLKLIAQTESSLVWLGQQKNTSEKLALKITQIIQKKGSTSIHQTNQKTFISQHNLKHMIHINQLTQSGQYRLIAMKYYPWNLEDLYIHYTTTSNRISNDKKYQFINYAFKGILNAVQELHSLGYVHRDLKLDNFMVDTQFKIYLTDFQLVTKELVTDSSLSGTLQYMAPQRLTPKRSTIPITKSVDIWSLGIILYEMFVGETPFTGDTSQQILDSIYQGFPRLNNIPQQIKTLIKGTLQINSSKRIGLNQIRNNIFFQRQVDITIIKDMMSK